MVVDDQAHVIAQREATSKRLAEYIAGLVKRRGAELKLANAKGLMRLAAMVIGRFRGPAKERHDPTSRLLRLYASGALDFSLERLGLNVGGLLIGTVETTSKSAINALHGLLNRPDILPQAIAAAAGDDPADFDGYVLEALRFDPPFPYFFRVCEQPTQLAGGTAHAQEIATGTTVMAVTHSAMFDAAGFAEPTSFDPSRPMSNGFLFGQGLHECLGRHIGTVMVPEIVRQVLRLPGIEAAGPLDKKGGPVPESYPLRWKA